MWMQGMHSYALVSNLVSLYHANPEAITVSEGYTLIDGEVPGEVWDDLAGLYQTRDGHVRLHTNFPQCVY
jgi:hypothetical protein